MRILCDLIFDHSQYDHAIGRVEPIDVYGVSMRVGSWDCFDILNVGEGGRAAIFESFISVILYMREYVGRCTGPIAKPVRETTQVVIIQLTQFEIPE